MPISSLTAAQQQILSATINTYVQDQLRAGNFVVYNQIRTATTAQIQAAIDPYLNTQLTAAQALVTALPARHTAETNTANQAVTDLQAIIAQLA